MPVNLKINHFGNKNIILIYNSIVYICTLNDMDMKTDNGKSKPLTDEELTGLVEPGKVKVKKFDGFVSVQPGKATKLSPDLTNCLIAIQSIIKKPLWLLMHDGEEKNDYGWLSPQIWNSIYKSKTEFIDGESIALIVESPGGDAESAYRIAKFLRNKCGSYSFYAPRYAKSAATLLSLGAREIFIGKEGDLGPLDVQIPDYDDEKIYSALDEVQALDSLFSYSTNQIIKTTAFWAAMQKKKYQSIFPVATEYVVGMMKPLMEKIDTVHYMSLSRKLNIAEEYAFRLLSDKCDEQTAKRIASNLVKKYPYHGFIIDANEARKVGLHMVREMSSELENLCDQLLSLIGDDYLIGKFYTQEAK